MFSSRRKLIKFIKLFFATLICSFLLSSLFALIHITLTVNINAAVLGLTLLISSIITYFYNEKLKRDKYKLESIERVELTENQITVETTVSQEVNTNGINLENFRTDYIIRDSIETTVETINNRTVDTGGGTYNEGIGRDAIGRDLVNRNIKNITIGKRDVEINPNDIVEILGELKDILTTSIAQSSNLLQAISTFTEELVEAFRKTPELKAHFNGDDDTSEDELVNSIMKLLLTNNSQIEGIPSLRQGMPYEQARQTLIDAGWQTIFNRFPLAATESQTRLIVNQKGWVELESCSGAGLGLCTFQFRDAANRILRVVTANNFPEPNSSELNNTVFRWFLEEEDNL